MRAVLILSLAMLASGCAVFGVHDPHWAGTNAPPLADSQRECHAQIHGNHSPDAFQACMESKGWHETR